MRTTAMVIGLALMAAASRATARTLGDARKAAWLSVAHPGLGEYYNAGWGDFFEHCPQKKFWLGIIPLYGWPGYLQVLSAVDAYHGRTSDNLTPMDGGGGGSRAARHAEPTERTRRPAPRAVPAR